MQSVVHKNTKHLSFHNPSLALWRPNAYSKVSEENISMATIHTPQPINSTFTSALLLVRHNDHAVIDKQIIRMIGIRHVKIVTSGVQAGLLLTQHLEQFEKHPDIIFCDEQLSDMSGQEFVSMLRTHPDLRYFPVIMMAKHETQILRENEKSRLYSAVAIRPYSAANLTKIVENVAKIHPPRQIELNENANTREFDRLLADYRVTTKINEQVTKESLKQGLIALKHGDYDQAIDAFKEALSAQPENDDVMKGLSIAISKKKEQAAKEPQKRKLSKEQADALTSNIIAASKSNNPKAAMEMAVIMSLDEIDLPNSNKSLILNKNNDVENLKDGMTWENDTRNEFGKSNAIAPLQTLTEPNKNGAFSNIPLLRDAINVAKITLGLYKIKK